MALIPRAGMTLPVVLRSSNAIKGKRKGYESALEVDCAICLSHPQQGLPLKVQLRPEFSQLPASELHNNVKQVPYRLVRIEEIHDDRVIVSLVPGAEFQKELHHEYLYWVASQAAEMGEDFEHHMNEYQKSLDRYRQDQLVALQSEQFHLTQEIERFQQTRNVLGQELIDAEVQKKALEAQKRLAESELQDRLQSLDVIKTEVDLLEQKREGFSKELLRMPLPDQQKSFGDLEAFESEQQALKMALDKLKQTRRIKPLDLAVLHAALKTASFTILTGPSGSGKTSLLLDYCAAMGMESLMVAVQPNWTGVEDLHGYVHPIHQKCMETPFSQALKRHHESVHGATPNPMMPVHLTVLDEVNLSQVEHYLADYLSALETRARRVRLPGTDGLVLPRSFLLAGTANEDHTTKAFSDKFMDRSAIIHVPPPEWHIGLLHPTTVESTHRITAAQWSEQGWLRVDQESPRLYKGLFQD